MNRYTLTFRDQQFDCLASRPNLHIDEEEKDGVFVPVSTHWLPLKISVSSKVFDQTFLNWLAECYKLAHTELKDMRETITLSTQYESFRLTKVWPQAIDFGMMGDDPGETVITVEFKDCYYNQH